MEDLSNGAADVHRLLGEQEVLSDLQHEFGHALLPEGSMVVPESFLLLNELLFIQFMLFEEAHDCDLALLLGPQFTVLALITVQILWILELSQGQVDHQCLQECGFDGEDEDLVAPLRGHDDQEIGYEDGPVDEDVVEICHHFEVLVDGLAWAAEVRLGVRHAEETREEEANVLEIQAYAQKRNEDGRLRVVLAPFTELYVFVGLPSEEYRKGNV